MPRCEGVGSLPEITAVPCTSFSVSVEGGALLSVPFACSTGLDADGNPEAETHVCGYIPREALIARDVCPPKDGDASAPSSPQCVPEGSRVVRVDLAMRGYDDAHAFVHVTGEATTAVQFVMQRRANLRVRLAGKLAAATVYVVSSDKQGNDQEVDRCKIDSESGTRVCDLYVPVPVEARASATLHVAGTINAEIPVVVRGTTVAEVQLDAPRKRFDLATDLALLAVVGGGFAAGYLINQGGDSKQQWWTEAGGAALTAAAFAGTYVAISCLTHASASYRVRYLDVEGNELPWGGEPTSVPAYTFVTAPSSRVGLRARPGLGARW